MLNARYLVLKLNNLVTIHGTNSVEIMKKFQQLQVYNVEQVKMIMTNGEQLNPRNLAGVVPRSSVKSTLRLCTKQRESNLEYLTTGTKI
jgi:uncharacterized alpha/beta hydrolase family protein